MMTKKKHHKAESSAHSKPEQEPETPSTVMTSSSTEPSETASAASLPSQALSSSLSSIFPISSLSSSPSLTNFKQTTSHLTSDFIRYCWTDAPTLSRVLLAAFLVSHIFIPLLLISNAAAQSVLGYTAVVIVFAFAWHCIAGGSVWMMSPSLIYASMLLFSLSPSRVDTVAVESFTAILMSKTLAPMLFLHWLRFIFIFDTVLVVSVGQALLAFVDRESELGFRIIIPVEENYAGVFREQSARLSTSATKTAFVALEMKCGVELYESEPEQVEEKEKEKAVLSPRSAGGDQAKEKEAHSQFPSADDQAKIEHSFEQVNKTERRCSFDH